MKWIFKKRPAAGATFECLGRRQKNAPSIWTPFKKKRNTFKQKQHMFFNFIIYVIIILTVFSHLFFNVLLIPAEI